MSFQIDCSGGEGEAGGEEDGPSFIYDPVGLGGSKALGGEVEPATEPATGRGRRKERK